MSGATETERLLLSISIQHTKAILGLYRAVGTMRMEKDWKADSEVQIALDDAKVGIEQSLKEIEALFALGEKK